MKRLFLSLTLMLTSLSFAAAPSNCVLQDRVCLDGPSTRVISGYSVTRDCWKYESKYSCEIGYKESDRCQNLRDKGCYETKNDCIESDSTGRCIAYQKEMYCPDGETGEGITDCSAKSFCMDGACFDTKYQPNGDLAKVVTLMEVGRQIGAYMETGIFKGVAEGCREGYGGVRDCCDTKPAGEASSMTNQALMSLPLSVASSAGAYAWSYTAIKATPYVYDVVTGTLGQGVANFTGLTDAFASQVVNGPAAFTWNFSFAGFGYTTGSTAAAGTFGTSSIALGSGSGAATATAGAAGGGAGGAATGGFYFSPVGFAIFAAVYLYGQLSSCEPEELTLAQHRAMNVCTRVPSASYCTKKILGSCVETKHMFCCYNSVLAKVISTEGKKQLGLPASFGKGNPNCDAIPVEQIQLLDFNKMDMSEFYSSISPGGKSADYWQTKIDSVQDYQNSRSTECQSITDANKRDECMKSGFYNESGNPAQFSDRVSGEDMASYGTKDFWIDRAKERVDYSVESGKADVQTNPNAEGSE